MRNLFEDSWGIHDHPHRHGDDEWFKIFFSYWINVDQAKRMIASGELTPKRVSYPVRHIAETRFEMNPSEFGSRSYEDSNSFSMSGPPVDRSRMPGIPDEKMDEPLLWVMFNSDLADALANRHKYRGEGKEFPVMVDGNHRLIKRYLEGDEGTVECDFLVGEDVLKVCYPAVRRGEMTKTLWDMQKGPPKRA